MATKFVARQTISKDTHTQIANNAANVNLANLLRSIDSELTMPLRLVPSSTANLVLHIEAISIENPETSRNRTIPPISNLIPNFTSGTVTFGSTGAGNATPSSGAALALGMTASQFMKVGIHLDPTGGIVLTKGTPGASEAAATAPAVPSGTYAIGFVTVQTDGSNNVANITNSAISQYVGGGSGSGGGSGGGNPILETLKNEQPFSPYDLFTPNIISEDAATKFDSLTGAAYDLVTNTIKFTADAQVAESVQMLDAEEFLGSGKDVNSVDLSVFWNRGTTLQAFTVPTAFTYEVSRNGGADWFAITMSRIGLTDTFYGSLTFDGSETPVILQSQTTNELARNLDGSSNQAVGQTITVTDTQVVNQVVLNLTNSSTSGNLFVSLVKDNAGVPSTSPSDILCKSAAKAVSSIAAGPATVSIALPTTVLTPGTYHIV